MSDDSMRAKARATFGKEFMDQMQVKPLAKNGAVALQQRANARPIPTYKDGGKVDDARISARMAAGNYKKGGKLTKKADGGVMDQYSGMPAPLQQPATAAPAYDDGTYGAGPKPMQPMVSNPNMPAPAYKKGGKVKGNLAFMIAIGKPMKGMKKPVKKAVGGSIVGAAKEFMKDAKDTGKRIQDRRDKRSTPWDQLTKKPVKKSNGGTTATTGGTATAASTTARSPLVSPAAVAAYRARMAKTPAQLAAERTAARAQNAANKVKYAADAAKAAATLQRGKDAAAKAKTVLGGGIGKQREINAMKAANAAKMAQNNQSRAANATARAANQARQVQLNQQKAANDAAMAARNARIAARTPVNRAVGGTGKTRKGMMKGK